MLKVKHRSLEDSKRANRNTYRQENYWEGSKKLERLGYTIANVFTSYSTEISERSSKLFSKG